MSTNLPTLNSPAPIQSRSTMAELEAANQRARDCEQFAALTFTTTNETRFWEIVESDVMFVNCADGGCLTMYVEDWDDSMGLIYLNMKEN